MDGLDFIAISLARKGNTERIVKKNALAEMELDAITEQVLSSNFSSYLLREI